MEALLKVVQFILNLGSNVMMPVFITLFGVILGMSLGRAFKAGLCVGVGLKGISLVSSMMSGGIKPISDALAARSANFQVKYVDIGWQGASAAAWATPFAAIVLPLGLVLNMLLFAVGFTKVINVDIWNYWHFLFAGCVAYITSGSFAIGFVVAMLDSVLALKFGDWSYSDWGEYFGVEGTACTTVGNIVNWGIAKFLNRVIFDNIPGFNKINISPSWLSSKIGVWGEPIIAGFFVGVAMGAYAGMNLATILGTGVTLGASMVLLPRMVALLMEGLSPIANAATKMMQKRFAGRDVLIGMDVALGLGDTTVIACAAIMIPVYLGIALAMPGNQWLPLLGLSSINYTCVFQASCARGNILRTCLGVGLFMTFNVWFVNVFAPTFNEIIVWSGYDDGSTTYGYSYPLMAPLLLLKFLKKD